jgi:hypothetical protein
MFNHSPQVALHWSLTQFTPAAMDVQPQNMLERILGQNARAVGRVDEWIKSWVNGWEMEICGLICFAIYAC